MFIGAHMPITGGIFNAVDRIMSIKGTALQIFSRNQRQWKFPPLKQEDIEKFKLKREKWGNYPVAVHDSYLINLASPKPEGVEKSIDGFSKELRRTESLGIEYLVTHPGSHLGTGVDAGIEQYVKNLDRSIEESLTTDVVVLLENTAGQGTNLGSKFEELAGIIDSSKYSKRLGVCFDTCHAFGAGYDLRTREAYEKTFEHFDKALGVDRIKFFHINDSKESLGSNKDRHDNIGKGLIGVDGFSFLMNDPRFADVPKVLETPKGDEKTFSLDKEGIELLRSLIK